MNASLFESWVDLLRSEGWTLVAGATFLLSAGIFAIWLERRSLVGQRRMIEWTAWAVLLWLPLALLPLPRLQWGPPDPAPQPQAALPTGGAAQPLQGPDLPSPQAARTPLAGGFAQPVPAPAVGRTPPRVVEPAESVWGTVEGIGIVLALGGALVLLRFALAQWRLRRILGRCKTASPELRRLLRQLQPAASRQPLLRVDPGEHRPFCCGLGRGTVVLPASLCRTEAQREGLRAVLRHELAHLEQGDPRARMLFALLAALLWWHPLFWWLRRRGALTAELLADARAAEALGTTCYARHMIDLSRETPVGTDGLLAAVPAVESRNQFYRRMKMLLQSDGERATRSSGRRRGLQSLGAASLLAVAVGLFGVEPLAAQDDLRGAVSRLQKENEQLRSALDEVLILLRQIQDKSGRADGQAGTAPRARDPFNEAVGVGSGAGGAVRGRAPRATGVRSGAAGVAAPAPRRPPPAGGVAGVASGRTGSRGGAGRVRSRAGGGRVSAGGLTGTAQPEPAAEPSPSAVWPRDPTAPTVPAPLAEPVPDAAPEPARIRDRFPTGGVRAGLRSGGSSLQDVMDLLDRLHTVETRLKVLEDELQHSAKLEKNGMISSRELRRLQSDLDVSRSTRDSLAVLRDVQTQAGELRMAHLTRQIRDLEQAGGDASLLEAERIELHGLLRALRGKDSSKRGR